jgi:MFS family permease
VAGTPTDRLGPRAPSVAGMALAAMALLALAGTALTHGSTSMLAATLAAVGVGAGVFMPANNTAIMTSAKARQAGVAGGVTNLTRGVGTSLGVALTGMVFDLAAGGTTQALLPTAMVQRGFAAAVIFLATSAAAAAVTLAALRDDPSSVLARPTS